MNRQLITGIILAGGQGRRMGRVDKGLQPLRGKPMVQHVLERFAPQVNEVLINANQNIEQYQTLGHKVVLDDIGGFAGPLAGLHRGLSAATHDLVATVPCDSPFLPLDLIARLYAALNEQHADLAVARTGDQPHPVFCLTRKSVLPGLTAFLKSGGRKIDAWYAALKVVEVRFDDKTEAFSNINTAMELRALEQTNATPNSGPITIRCKDDAIALAEKHASAVRLDYPDYQTTCELRGKTSDGWLFVYKIRCLKDIPSAEQEKFGGATGFLISNQGIIQVLTWPKYFDAEKTILKPA